MRRRAVPFLVVAGLAVAGLAARPVGAQAPPDPPDPPPGDPVAAVAYQPPVLAPVVAAFDAPASSYGPGNRGLEYGTSSGDPVRAGAGGTVTFVGWVAGDLYVTLLHADRVRTTYGRLASTTAAAGARLGPGDQLGTATDRFIWTARIGDAYVDPAVLLAASGRPIVRLVPDRPGGPGPRSGPVPDVAADWALEPRRP